MVELQSKVDNAGVAVAVMIGQEAVTIVPGEPISEALLAAMNAPLIPTALNCVIGVTKLFCPIALSKVVNGAVVGEAPNKTEETGVLLTPLYKFTWSPPVPKPIPVPV